MAGVTVALSALLVSPLASATASLDTLVVTGTRGERRLLDVPVRTEVVSRREIERTHARDVAEALRHSPGLFLRDIHGKGGTEVWMQGLDSDRVLVMVDGRPVGASTGSTVDLTRIGTSDVERIEIVKGAVSALYGSAAMGGVINVITRENDAPLATRLVLDAGSHGSHGVGGDALGERHLAAGASVRRGTVDAGFDVDLRDGDGFDLDDTTYVFEGDRGTRLDLGGEIGFDLGDADRLEFTSRRYDEDVDRDFSTFAPGVGEVEKLDAERATRLTRRLDWRRELGGDASLQAWISFERLDDETVQDIVATGELDQRRDARITTTRLDIQHDRPLGENQVLTVGASASAASLDQSLSRDGSNGASVVDEIEPGASRRTVELFVQDDIFLGERWELLPGIRVQDDSDFGRHVAPKINALYEPPVLARWNPRLRAGIGTGYRAPNLKERYFRFDHSALGYVVLGTESLEPERSLNLQLGLEISRTNGMRAELSVFHNRITDLIQSSRDAAASEEAALEVFRYANVDDARTGGVEASASRAFGERLSLNGAWAWLDAVDRSTGNRLTRRPRNQLQFGVDLTFGRTAFALRATWQDEEYVDAENTIESPAHTALALKLDRTVTPSLTLFAGIDNLVDEHRDPDRAGLDLRPEEGRFVYAGVRYAWAAPRVRDGLP